MTILIFLSGVMAGPLVAFVVGRRRRTRFYFSISKFCGIIAIFSVVFAGLLSKPSSPGFLQFAAIEILYLVPFVFVATLNNGNKWLGIVAGLWIVAFLALLSL
jgi:hypothetical protein